MSHIVLIPDWSVVLAESSPLLFLFPSLSLFFLYVSLLSFLFAWVFFSLSLSPSHSLILSSVFPIFPFSLFSFPKISLVARRFFFSFFLFTSSVSTAKRTHTYKFTHTRAFRLSLKKKLNMSSTEVQLSERVPMLSATDEAANSNPAAPAAVVSVPVETTTVVTTVKKYAFVFFFLVSN